MSEQLIAEFVTAALNFATAWLQGKSSTDISAEMQQAIDRNHAEMARLKSVDPSIGDDEA